MNRWHVITLAILILGGAWLWWSRVPEPARAGERTEQPTLNHPAPAFALKLVFGDMAQATILASQRVIPEKLADAGFEFRHPHVAEAIAFELTRSADPAGH